VNRHFSANVCISTSKDLDRKGLDMSAVFHDVPLDKRLDALFDIDAAPISIGEITRLFGVRHNTVLGAIHDGKLPAHRVTAATGRTSMWLVRPRDALLIWGHRLRRETTD